MTRGQEAALRRALASAKATHTSASKLADLAVSPSARRDAERLRLQSWRLVEALREELRQQVAQEFVATRMAENAAEVVR